MATIYETIKNGEMDIDQICQIIATNRGLQYILDDYVIMNHCFDYDGEKCEYYDFKKKRCDLQGSAIFRVECPKFKENQNAIRRILLGWFNEELES